MFQTTLKFAKTGLGVSYRAIAAVVRFCLPYLKRARPQVVRFLKEAFMVGPRQLVTSRISGRCAILMIMLCVPSLLFCSMLTVTRVLFSSPDQYAYFHFAQILNKDPVNWVTFVLSSACAILALAVPASMLRPASGTHSLIFHSLVRRRRVGFPARRFFFRETRRVFPRILPKPCRHHHVAPSINAAPPLHAASRG